MKTLFMLYKHTKHCICFK